MLVLNNGGGDTGGPDCGLYVSFDLSASATELEGKQGINLLIPTRENGNKELKIDLPEEK